MTIEGRGASNSTCIPIAVTRQAAAGSSPPGQPRSVTSPPRAARGRLWCTKKPTPAPATAVMVQCEPTLVMPSRSSAELSTDRSGLVPPDSGMLFRP
jgi:hypothetical protein